MTDIDHCKQRFEAKIEKTSGCWTWLGYRRASGYGRFQLDGFHCQAHRVAYMLFVGEIPEGLSIDHLCRNRSCVNPSHLEPVTSRENTLRGFSPPAVQARQQRCVHGHLFDAMNTWISKGGKRYCRTCHRLASAKRRERQRDSRNQPAASTTREEQG